jgi:hypothetical protein
VKTTLKTAAVLALLIALSSCADIALKTSILKELGITSIRVGSLSTSRTGTGYSLDGANMQYVRSKLLNTANFGPSGVVKKSIVITDFTGTLDASVLEKLDVLFVGWVPDGIFSSAEIAAIKSWVSSGGTIIISADDPTHDDIASAFGCPISSTYPLTISDYTVIEGSGLPLFTGPFGNLGPGQAIFGGTTYAGAFSSISSFTELGYDFSTAFISVLYGSYGSGKAIILGTIDYLSDDGLDMTWDSAISSSSYDDIFLGNVFASVKP